MKMTRKIRRQMAAAALAAGLLIATPAMANPNGSSNAANVIVSGEGTANTVVTLQSGTQRGVLDWDSFSQSGGETLTFDMNGNQNAAVLNRVTGKNESILCGAITTANDMDNGKHSGQVYIVNPNGISFNGAAVNCGAFVASALAVDDAARGNWLANGGALRYEDTAGKHKAITLANGTNINAANNVVLLGSGAMDTADGKGDAAVIKADRANGEIIIAACKGITVDTSSGAPVYSNVTATEYTGVSRMYYSGNSAWTDYSAKKITGIAAGQGHYDFTNSRDGYNALDCDAIEIYSGSGNKAKSIRLSGSFNPAGSFGYSGAIAAFDSSRSFNISTAAMKYTQESGDLDAAAAHAAFAPKTAAQSWQFTAKDGDIVQGSKLVIAEKSAFVAADNHKIILNNSENSLKGAVSLIAGGTGAAELVVANELLELGKCETGTAGMIVNAANGAVWQSGALKAEKLMVNAKATVVLKNKGNVIKDIVINTTDADIYSNGEIFVHDSTLGNSLVLNAEGDVLFGKMVVGEGGLKAESYAGDISQRDKFFETQGAISVIGDTFLVANGLGKKIRMQNYYNVFSGIVSLVTINNRKEIEYATGVLADWTKPLVLGNCVTGGRFFAIGGSVENAVGTKLTILQGGGITAYAAGQDGKIDISVDNYSGSKETYITTAWMKGGNSQNYRVRVNDLSANKNGGAAIPMTIGGMQNGNVEVLTNCEVIYNNKYIIRNFSITNLDGVSSTNQYVRFDKQLVAAGNVSINAGSIQINQPVTASAVYFNANGSGNSIVIGNAGKITSTITGLEAGQMPAITLNCANGNFVNNAGAGALVVQPKSGGTYAPFWLVYTADKTNSQAAFNGMMVKDAVGNPVDNPANDDKLKDGANHWMHKING